jgi:hypothetical protein
MKNSLRPAILIFGILIMGMLSMNIAYGQTRIIKTATMQTGPAVRRAPLQRIKPFPARSGIYFRQSWQRPLIKTTSSSIQSQQRLTTYRTLLLPKGNVIRIR